MRHDWLISLVFAVNFLLVVIFHADIGDMFVFAEVRSIHRSRRFILLFVVVGIVFETTTRF